MKIQLCSLIAALFVCGCAYFNTYYNAKKFFNQAEEARKKQERQLAVGTEAGTGKPSSKTSYSDLYDKAIKKASAILEFHSGSRWVDDSLFLLGQAFYWQGEYQKARVKFEELEANFPKSPFLSEARYRRGLCLWKLGENDRAQEILTVVAEQQGGKLSGYALLTLGEMAFEEEDYREALDFYTRVAHHRSASKEQKAQAWERIGECYVTLKEYDRAIDALRRVLEMAPSATLRYTAMSTIGTCLQLQHRYGDALTVYQDLLKEERFRPFFPRLSLSVAECYRGIGRVDRALETYERIPLDAPNTEEAALALYAVGEVYQKHFNDFQKAKEFFEQTQKIGGRFEVAQRAKKRVGDIAMLDHYRSLVTTNPDSAAAAQFHLGELYWLTFEQADSAIATYRNLVERFPESDWAPKALYAVGWLQEQSADTTRATATYGELLERYPGTDYADTARVRMGMEGDIGGARRLFLEAEAKRLSGAGEDVYLPLFEEVVTSDSKSSYAARALYVIGWTYESVLGDSLRAVECYKRLLENFPTSDLVVAARQRISLQERVSPPRILPTTQDSVVVSLDRQANRGVRVDGTPDDRVDEGEHGTQPDWDELDEAVVDSLDSAEP